MEMLFMPDIWAGAATLANHRTLADACQMPRICSRRLNRTSAVFHAPNIVFTGQV